MWGRPYRVKPRLRGLPKGPSRASARIYTLDAVPICTGGHREGASLRYSHDLRWLGEEAKCLLSSATNCHLAISHAHFAHDLLFYTLSYYFFAQHYTYETFISTGLNRCTCKREVIKSSCGLGQSNHKSWPSQNSQPLPFKSPHGPMAQPYRQIFIWHVSFHDPVYKVFTGAYDAWTHFNVVSQGQNLLERTFPLHMTLNSDIYIAQFKGLVPPVQLSRLARCSGKSFNLQRGPFLTGESPRYHPNVLHPSLRISIDSEDCLL